MPQLVITALGADKPGLVGKFTGQLHKAGGNIADSRMINLRGQFTLLMLIEGSEATLRTIRKTLPGAAKKIGLQVDFSSSNKVSAPFPGVPYQLRTYSMDQPGIVHQVTDILRTAGVNIEELSTRLESAPHAGMPLFTLNARLTIPAKVSLRDLRKKLDVLSAKMNCDIDLEPA